MNKTITVRISEDIREKLEEVSRFENKPLSDFVRESLRKYLSIYRFRKLRNLTLPFAESQGILTDEDIFKEIS